MIGANELVSLENELRREKAKLLREVAHGSFIYAQANDRNIPVAQVIEEATEALRREQLARS